MLCNVNRLLVRRTFFFTLAGILSCKNFHSMVARHIITTFIFTKFRRTHTHTERRKLTSSIHCGLFHFLLGLEFTIIEFWHEHFILQSLDEIVTDSLFTSVWVCRCAGIGVVDVRFGINGVWHDMCTLHVLRRQIPHITISIAIFSSCQFIVVDDFRHVVHSHILVWDRAKTAQTCVSVFGYRAPAR